MRNHGMSVLLVLCSAVCGGSQTARGDMVHLALVDTVTVDSPLFTLGDVARVTAVNPEDARRISALILAPAPVEGRVLRVTHKLIRERLIASGENVSRMEFGGRAVSLVISRNPVATTSAAGGVPREPAVSRMTAPDSSTRAIAASAKQELNEQVSVAALQRQAAEVIEEAFRDQFRPCEQQPHLLHAQVTVSDDAAARILAASHPRDVRFLFNQVALGGPQPWGLRLANQPAQLPSLMVQAVVTERLQLVTVNRPIAKGELLSHADLSMIPAGTLTGVSDPVAAMGLQASRPLRPGTPLQTDDLVAPRLVRNNDIVNVRVRCPGIVVQRPFKAMASGAAGDTITLVALDDAREKIQATVTGYHLAEMQAPHTTTERQPATGNHPATPLRTERAGSAGSPSQGVRGTSSRRSGDWPEGGIR